MKIILILFMMFYSSTIHSHSNELSASKNIMCKPLRDAFLQNIDAIIQLEVVNFMLKKDNLYTEKYSEYYDHALSHFDVRTLLKAIDVIAANCPVSAKGN